MTMIEVRHLTKTYGQGSLAVHAVQDVTFAVQAGEVLLLEGPSGSGKTTLLSILGCVLSPTSGSVKLVGQELTGLAERHLPQMRRKYIGFIFQSHNLLGALSAWDNVRLPLILRGTPKAEAGAQAEALLIQVGLGEKARRLPEELSGGQKQRVAIARALAGRPPILLCDEPTAALDAQNGQAVLETLTELAHAGGHTVIVVTHDNRIFKYGDRILHMEDGRLVKEEIGQARPPRSPA